MGQVMSAAAKAAAPEGGGGFELFVSADGLTLTQIVVLMGVYGYILFIASNLISDGSELCLLVPEYASMVGSVVLPILGAVPDGIMVLFSGLGPADVVQNEIAVGVGALAGSTVMLLTLPWMIAVIFGRVDYNSSKNEFNYSKPKDAGDDWSKLTPGNWAMSGCGVTYHKAIRDNAKMMLVTTTPYLAILVPSIFFDKIMKKGEHKLASQTDLEARKEHWFSLLGLGLCIFWFLYYMYLQWADSQNEDSEVQEKIRELECEAIEDGQLTLRGVMAQFESSAWATEVDAKTADKATLEEVRGMCKILAPFFGKYDINGDNRIDFEEFRLLFKDMRAGVSKEMEEHLFDAADVDGSKYINFEEFVGIIICFSMASDQSGNRGPPKQAIDPKVFYAPNDEEETEEDDMPEDLADLSPEEQQKRIKSRAYSMMGAGTFLVVVFSDPMVDLLGAMGKQIGIPAFYVAFVLAPMASNASELVAAANYAQKKTIRSMTTSLSTLEGAGVMNNTFTLGVFLGLIFVRGIAWQFTAETIVIILVEVLIGVTVLLKPKQLLYDALIIFCYYPLSLAVVWALENKLHID